MILSCKKLRLAAVVFCAIKVIACTTCVDGGMNPYDDQVTEKTEQLKTGIPKERGLAAEALGYLRAYSSADALTKTLGDKSAEVRREAATALGWCGARGEVVALLKALDDSDWVVRQVLSFARHGSACGTSITASLVPDLL